MNVARLGTCAAGAGHWATDPGGFIGRPAYSWDAPWLCRMHRAPLFDPPKVGERVRYLDGHDGPDLHVVEVEGGMVRVGTTGPSVQGLKLNPRYPLRSRHVFYRSAPEVCYEAGSTCRTTTTAKRGSYTARELADWNRRYRLFESYRAEGRSHEDAKQAAYGDLPAGWEVTG